MTNNHARRALAGGASFAALLCLSWPTVLAQGTTLDGVFALPGADQAVTGQLKVTETAPLSRRIELNYTSIATGDPIAEFDVELTQQLHILATDAGLTHLIHQHADEVRSDGTFTAEIEFPEPGRYHIYTDATPTGIGQQVLRFDVNVGVERGSGESRPAGADISDGPLISSDGPYTVTLGASQLHANVESAVSLLVEKEGLPAADLAPYLGVSAHAVFIRVEDLAYVHAHAMPGGKDQPRHDTHGAAAAEPHDMGSHHGADHQAAPATDTGHAGHAAAPAIAVAPAMSLHVTPPAAGAYALWIEFIAGGEIRTVPFTIEIPGAEAGAIN
jgi:hypothetical protein